MALRRWSASLFLMTISALCAVSSSPLSARQSTPPPQTMLWAWERPEDLRFIDTKRTGVAYLAATIKIKRDSPNPICINRHQPLDVPPGTYMMPVIRIESDGTLSETNLEMIQKIAALVPHYLKPTVRGFQFDFDARRSERGWYRQFLTTMRGTLPADIYLSMTSIASWCLGDDWISSANLPVDEIVPMFFEMGADSKPIAALLGNGNIYGHKYQSLGISDKEQSINKLLGNASASILMPTHRIYMFSRTPWNQRKAQTIIQEVNNWK